MSGALQIAGVLVALAAVAAPIDAQSPDAFWTPFLPTGIVPLSPSAGAPMRHCLAMSLVLLAACATSKGATAPPTPDQTFRIPTYNNGPGTTLIVASSTAPSVRSIKTTPEKIWNVLPAVYDSLGIPVTERDPATRSIGNASLKIRRDLGGVRLSRYLDCGDTQGSPSADSYEILLSMKTQLTPDAAGTTTVTTTVDAMGRPVFVASEYIHCGSKGGIEKRFFDILNAELLR